MFYESVSWAMLTFIVGLFLGGGIVYRLRTNATSTQPEKRHGYEWARKDFHVAPAELQDVFIRHETDWQGSGTTDGKSVSFSIADGLGIQRDLTFSAALLSKFLRSGDPGPRRSGFRGDNTEYGRLLSVARYYQWVTQEGSSYAWREFLATRERRLITLEAWLS